MFKYLSLLNIMLKVDLRKNEKCNKMNNTTKAR